ncbi:MAG: septum formation inhibitor Maf [Gammaproteobacteria bacterium]|nr:MAG: septum formation inhibitor Maf [Gammaproteobacteria bacterium]
MTELILASASPRRKELLCQIGVVFTVSPSVIDETPISDEPALRYVKRMAQEKALAVYPQYADKDCCVLGADTIVVSQQQVFGKPKDKADAIRMLSSLSGKTHTVYSAVTLISEQRQEQIVSATEVTFRDITMAEIEAYWVTGEPKGKAGGYAIQGLAAIFVENISGSYSGVVGLPLMETSQLLTEFGIPVLALGLD